MAQQRTMEISMKGFITTVTLESNVQTVTASSRSTYLGQLFLESESKEFSGFCDMEIAYKLACEALATRQQIESHDIWDYLAENYGECECD